ncbi:uncharacterized protein LOC107263838 [Cephus cinctus]|uniref:Uncharacterized protein LOC107263838 n=1 Tax=Cephus cinctus TaxID=211228 RepID=A0AAJ7FDX2_CEPCN|nr:uncharacterized protein LOC107263838 [Cephus cinctus]
MSKSIVRSITSLGTFLWSLIIQLHVFQLWEPVWAYGSENEPDDDTEYRNNDEVHQFESYSPKLTDDPIPGRKEMPVPSALPPVLVTPPAIHATPTVYSPYKLRACEKKTDLYILQPERLNTSGQSNPLKGKLTNCHVTGCERPFSVQKIRHTNLILLVVDTLCPCGSKQLSIEPIEAVTEPGACTARRERLYRRRPPKCINYHPEEMEIKYCGNSISRFNEFGLVSNLMIVSAITATHFT